MAAVDKLYGSSDEYDIFHKWAKENRPDILKYFYPREGYTGQRPMTNFPEEIDEWLLENCPLQFVIDGIKDQYNLV